MLHESKKHHFLSTKEQLFFIKSVILAPKPENTLPLCWEFHQAPQPLITIMPISNSFKICYFVSRVNPGYGNDLSFRRV
jgi:hypothetical protein